MNNVLNTNKSYGESMRILLKAKYILLQQALVGLGLSPDLYSTLNPECYTNSIILEERKGDWIDYYLLAIGCGFDPATLPNINDCETDFSAIPELI